MIPDLDLDSEHGLSRRTTFHITVKLPLSLPRPAALPGLQFGPGIQRPGRLGGPQAARANLKIDSDDLLRLRFRR